MHTSGPLKMHLKAVITVDVLVPTPLAQRSRPETGTTRAVCHCAGTSTARGGPDTHITNGVVRENY